MLTEAFPAYLTAVAEHVVKTTASPANRTGLTKAAVRLDRLDVQILRELLQGPITLPLNPDFRRSFRSIARIVGVDEDTVRNRLSRLKESGFIEDWAIMLNPNLLGFHQTGISFDVASSISKRELISRLKLVPDVFLIIDMYGSSIALMLAYDSPTSLKNRVDLIGSLGNLTNLRLFEALWPDSNIDMSVSDWRILRSIQRDPRKSYSTIAREVRTSTRTVVRRLQRMVQAKTLFSMAALNPKTLDGNVLVSLMAYHSIKDRLMVAQKVSHELSDYLWHTFFTMPKDSPGKLCAWFSLALPSIAKAHEVLDWASNQNYMSEPRLELWEDHNVLLRTLDHWLERKLHSLGIN